MSVDLSTLSPGDTVEAYEALYQFAGLTDSGDAVLVEDLKADLELGYGGDPSTRFITANATARTYRATTAAAHRITRA